VNQPVTITIDVLSVEGLDAAQAHRMGSALESELGELIRSDGFARGLSASGWPAHLTLEGLAVTAARPEQTGRQLARLLYRRLAR
jgi:hypothetical protein